MRRRLHMAVTLLAMTLASPGLLVAQNDASEDDNGWFDAAEKPEGDAPPEPTQADAKQRPPPPADDADPQAFSQFRPHLDAYGHWVEDGQYGTVWVPYEQSVGTGFAPYVSGGRWVLSTRGDWVWSSDYPFGWIVFHYGRWVWTPAHGWAWIPGYRYAPAWVVWRVPSGGDAYVGWAPAGPAFIWVHGRPVSLYYGPPYYWVFCPSYYAFHAHVHYYIVRDRPLMRRLASSTRHYVPPRPGRTPASPTPAVARVPARALPRDRVDPRPVEPRATPLAPPSTRSARVPTRERPVAVPAPAARVPAPAPVPRTRPTQRKTVSPRAKPTTLRPVTSPRAVETFRKGKRR